MTLPPMKSALASVSVKSLTVTLTVGTALLSMSPKAAGVACSPAPFFVYTSRCVMPLESVSSGTVSSSAPPAATSLPT